MLIMKLKEATDSFGKYEDFSWMEEESELEDLDYDDYKDNLYGEEEPMHCEDSDESLNNYRFHEPVIVSRNIWEKRNTIKTEVTNHHFSSVIKSQEKEQEITDSYQQVSGILDFCTKHYL